MDEMVLGCAGPTVRKNYVSVKETAAYKEKILAAAGAAQQRACAEERLLLIKTVGERSAILSGSDGGSGSKSLSGVPEDVAAAGRRPRGFSRPNEALGVHPRPKSCDRSWSEEEVTAIIEAALGAGKAWVADVVILAYELGLRIHIRQHRKPRPVPLTFHGLRYTDAQEHYCKCLAAGPV
jgi:hypothetical protein